MLCSKIPNPSLQNRAIQRFTSVKRGTFTGLGFTTKASRGQLQKFWRGKIMDPLKEVMKISTITIIFGLLSVVIGWLSIIADPALIVQLREIAIVLLVLFFYSLTMDKIEEIEEKIKIVSAGRKKQVNLVP
jgi:hypothetical protein